MAIYRLQKTIVNSFARRSPTLYRIQPKAGSLSHKICTEICEHLRKCTPSKMQFKVRRS